MTWTVLVALTAAVGWGLLAGQEREPPLQSAELAWTRGDYVTALETYRQVLEGSPSAAALERIALQTGELYQTVELTPDGRTPQFSPDGRIVVYETGTGEGRATRLVRVDDPSAPPATYPGFGAVFSPDGSQLAFIAAGQAVGAAPDPAALRIVVRHVATGAERVLEMRGFVPAQVAFGMSSVWFSGQAPGDPVRQIYEVAGDGPPVARTGGPASKIIVRTNATGSALVFTEADPPDPSSRPAERFHLLATATGRDTTIEGSSPAFSGDGETFAYVARNGGETRLLTAPTAAPADVTVLRSGPQRLDAPALSRDGRRIAFQVMADHDWEIHAIDRDAGSERRMTHDIQHDVLPQFVGNDRLLAATGEARHRRSSLYEWTTGRQVRLFHNNTVRTIAPEYAWAASADGTHILVAADRDGDTVSPERGVYLVDLMKRVTLEALRARVTANLAAERALRAEAVRMFAPIAPAVSAVVDRASRERIYGYEKALSDMGTKYIGQPGNAQAAAFLFDSYRSFGYLPEYQPFEYRMRDRSVVRTANVLATLKGTVSPDIVYLVSSHYDSALAGPGADDNTSGTAALLETARLLAGHPQPATILFASFTGEEAGLLGSREFARRAVASGMRVAGALNNDTVGWANDARLDDTIRYSNAGIRDLQHAAALQFSSLITYDSRYYKNTDAAACYEAFGDIIGGIGSYPVLGSPHYHQAHDQIETINHQLVTEVARTTAASVMLLASSPAPVRSLAIAGIEGGTTRLTWAPSAEGDVIGYTVDVVAAAPGRAARIRVDGPAARLPGVGAGARISVKAVNSRGLEGWDGATVRIGPR